MPVGSASEDRASGAVVTPEAVPLDFEAADIGSRFVALMIDLAVMATMLFGLMVAAGLLAGLGALDWASPAAGLALILLLIFGVVWGYPIGFETALRGRTPGKSMMGLRVVTVEGGPIGFRHAALRAALALVDFVLTSGFAALVSTQATRRHQRLGDLAAGTFVVVERAAAARPAPVRFPVPPDAQAHAAALDVTGLRREDYAVVRAFLLRSGDLEPGDRQRLAAAIATSLAPRLPPGPPDVPPELFLRCVAARYQQSVADEPPHRVSARTDPVPSRPDFAPPA